MKFVLMCDCGNMDDFDYEDSTFTCTNCGISYHEEEAGKHLMGDDD